MAIQYPDFRADPNAVPQLKGLPTFVESLQKGYQMAQLPEQMRMQRAMQQQQLQKGAMENYYTPLQNEAQLKQSAAATQGQELTNQNMPALFKQQADLNAAQVGKANADTQFTNTQNRIFPTTAAANNAEANARARLYGTQNRAAQEDLNETIGFNNLMAGGAVPQQGTAPQQGQLQPQMQPNYAPGAGQAPYMQPQQGGQPNMMQSQQGGVQQSSNPLGTMTSPGNSSMYRLDEIALNNPQYAERLKKAGYDIKTETSFNDKLGTARTTTTLPSGKTFVNDVPLEDVQAANQKAALQENIAKTEGADWGRYTSDIDTTNRIQSHLNSMRDTAELNDFSDAVGPVNSLLANKFGKGAGQRMTSTVDADAGAIQAEMANNIKGNAAKAKLAFVAKIKPSSSDPYQVYRGKLEALNTSNKWVNDYSSYVAQAMRNGTPEDVAIKEADKAIPWDKYKGEMDYYVDNGQAANKFKSDAYVKQGYKVIYAPDNSGRVDSDIAYIQIPAPGGIVTVPAQNAQKYLDKMGGGNG